MGTLTPILWAAVALLALGGWAATLVLLARSLLPMANALFALTKVDSVIDDRIAKVVNRLRERADKAPAARPGLPPTVAPPNAAADAMRDLFGAVPFERLDEQPDADGVEVVSA